MRIPIPFTLAFVLALAACTPYKNVSEKEWKAAEQQYELSVKKVEQRLGLDNGYPLFPLDGRLLDKEGYLTVMAWKGAEAAKNYYNAPGEWDTLDSKYLTWVFAENQFQEEIERDRLYKYSGEGLALRLDQLLGLPPSAGDTSRVLITFKVKPSDLFRPCPDPEINDCSCVNDSTAGSYTAPFGNGYRPVYEGLIQSQAGWPWTRLGYTYDWRERSNGHFGMSEYIIRQGAVVRIEAKSATQAWIKAQK